VHFPRQQPIFESRFDAGRQLAIKLNEYKKQPVVVLAIPNGGLPVALQVALALRANLDLVISRKLPIPLRPEGGFGAVADDGTIILNQEVLKKLGLSAQQINYQVSKVRNDIQKRSLLYRGSRPLSVVSDKIAIVIDDGLASGYTMMAAVESVRRRHPKRVVVAVPTASATAVKQVEKLADRVVTVVTTFSPGFYVSDFYRYWNVLSDEEGLKCLKEWQMRHREFNIKPPQQSNSIQKD
jgi:predicted phosphoribosyltransferase|tara:strand:- start:355 stop:1071 length:717 start_codon:yes stop_codon:yes gene_type:complete